ncbi:hypothetical protein [Bifidobacterium subtile]|uniref:hypothetical protein n=1 Tax=Bifidobacterium subtile TaxID=77635 RepID=UPI002F35FC15
MTEQRPPYRGNVFRFLRAAAWPGQYRTPAWAKHLQTMRLDDGTTAYRCYPVRLDATAFSDFQLLDRCGWNVTVTRHPSGIAVTINLKERAPAMAENQPHTLPIPSGGNNE